MRSVGAALRLAPVWLSPAALLGLASGLLVDGTRGLLAPLLLTGGAVLVVRALATPWSRSGPGGPGPLLDLAALRWPSRSRTLAPLAVADTATTLLFLWAQLAATREVAHALGWPPAGALAAAGLGLALGTWREGLAARLGAAGGAALVTGLVVPIAAVALATSPWWPRVWDEVASRPRIVFAPGGPWTETGQLVRGPGRELTVVAGEGQEVRLPEGGAVRLEPREGGGARHDVAPGGALTLHAGDRLVVEDGLRLRFQAGRRIPGAPVSGADWVSPPGRRLEAPALIGLGVTLLVGALGLPAAHALLPGTSAGAARLGAGIVVAGTTLVGPWALYAAWLTPAVYLAGVAGVEVYELPAAVTGLGRAGNGLRLLALAGLVAGGLAAGLAALRGIPRDLPRRGGRSAPLPALAAIGLAGLLAALVPVDSWTVLVTAFGLAAAAGGPAAVLTTWSERATPRAVAGGVVLGVLVFAALTAASVLGPGDPRGAEGWLAWLAGWPALAAAPANLLAAWLAGRAGSAGSPRPPGLAGVPP